MPYSTYLKNRWLDALRNVSFTVEQCHVSAHTADPGDTGANEVRGGSPAYERAVIRWNAARGGAMDDVNGAVFNIPPGTTVSHIGFWDRKLGGNFLGSAPVTSETFAGQGTYSVTAADLDLNAASTVGTVA